MNGMLPPAADARKRRLRIRNGMGRERLYGWPRSGPGARRALYRARCDARAVSVLCVELNLPVPTRGIPDCLRQASVHGDGPVSLLIERIERFEMND